MKSKLIYKEKINGKEINKFIKIGNIEDNEISFRHDYNDKFYLEFSKNEIFVKRQGTINYSLKHELNKTSVFNILIKYLDKEESFETEILTKEISISDNKDNIYIKYIKGDDVVESFYKIKRSTNE